MRLSTTGPYLCPVLSNKGHTELHEAKTAVVWRQPSVKKEASQRTTGENFCIAFLTSRKRGDSIRPTARTMQLHSVHAYAIILVSLFWIP